MNSSPAPEWNQRVALARRDAPAPRDPGPLLRAARAARVAASAPADFGTEFAVFLGARPALAAAAALVAVSLSAIHAASVWSDFSAWIDLFAVSGGILS